MSSLRRRFAAVELSTSALWSMRIVPARIELIEPRLFLSYSENGGLALSFSKPVETEAQPMPAPTPLSLPTRLPVAVPAPGARARLRRAAGGTAEAHRSGARRHRHVGARAPAPRCEHLICASSACATRPCCVDYAGRTTEWHVPSLNVGLMHAPHAQRHLGPGDTCRGAAASRGN